MDKDRYRGNQRRRPSATAWPVGLLLVGAAGIGYSADTISLDGFTALSAALPGSGCNIKGNVSINSGERIYHVPGQEYYLETIIRPEFGERWFCTEADARKAGWRKAKA